MDLSCGRGGDVERYIKSDNNIKFVLGLDIEDINEASRRYFYKQANNKAVFLQYDTSKNIKSKEQSDINKHSKVMIDILYGTAKRLRWIKLPGLGDVKTKHGKDFFDWCESNKI